MNFKRLFTLVLVTASLSVFFGCAEDNENITPSDLANDNALNSGGGDPVGSDDYID